MRPGPGPQHLLLILLSHVSWLMKRCRQWCQEVPTMVPYNAPRSVSVCIGLHRSGGRAPDYVSKDRRRKPQGRWSLRRQIASRCIDFHRIAREVRETGVEPARVAPLDPKSRLRRTRIGILALVLSPSCRSYSGLSCCRAAGVRASLRLWAFASGPLFAVRRPFVVAAFGFAAFSPASGFAEPFAFPNPSECPGGAISLAATVRLVQFLLLESLTFQASGILA